MNPDPDLEIIRRVLDGGTESFEILIVKYQEKVLRLCASMVGISQAEDAAQEIFLKAYQSLSSFKGESQFSTWIYRISANHCLNLLRKRKREQTLPLEETLISDSKPTASHVFENRHLVHKILASMEPQDRAILSLREVEGLSYQELSKVLGLSLDLVKVRLYRARQAFLSHSKRFL